MTEPFAICLHSRAYLLNESPLSVIFCYSFNSSFILSLNQYLTLLTCCLLYTRISINVTPFLSNREITRFWNSSDVSGSKGSHTVDRVGMSESCVWSHNLMCYMQLTFTLKYRSTEQYHVSYKELLRRDYKGCL